MPICRNSMSLGGNTNDSHSTRLKLVPTNQIELWSEANARRMDVLLDIDELANNIKAVGLQNPIVVQEEIPNELYRIISGQRRWLACRKIGLKDIPCIITPKKTLEEAKIASFSENQYRREMNPRDKSDTIDYLYRKYGSVAEVARRLGVSGPTVTKYIGYAKVPDVIKDLVARKFLTVGQALSIYSKYPDEKHAVTVAKRIAEIKDKTEKRRLIAAVDISSPRDDFDTIHNLAKKMGEMKEYLIHLPPRTSVALEKAAKSINQDPEVLIIDATEKWLEDNRYLG